MRQLLLTTTNTSMPLRTNMGQWSKLNWTESYNTSLLLSPSRHQYKHGKIPFLCYRWRKSNCSAISVHRNDPRACTSSIKRVYLHQLLVSLEHRQVHLHPLDPANTNNKVMMNHGSLIKRCNSSHSLESCTLLCFHSLSGYLQGQTLSPTYMHST